MNSTSENLAIGWTTTENQADAEALARLLIEKKLAGCAQISGPITSVYPWRGQIQTDTEYRLTIKYPTVNDAQILKELETHHPYDVPQWVTASVQSAHPQYAEWIREETR